MAKSVPVRFDCFKSGSSSLVPPHWFHWFSPKIKSTRTSCDENRHSVPNGDSHCRDDRIGQAWLDWVSGGKRRSTCDVRNGEKQKFRPAFVSKECNGCHKNPKHDFRRSKKQSRAKEEQCWQYQQACQNRSSPG